MALQQMFAMSPEASMMAQPDPMLAAEVGAPMQPVPAMPPPTPVDVQLAMNPVSNPAYRSRFIEQQGRAPGAIDYGADSLAFDLSQRGVPFTKEQVLAYMARPMPPAGISEFGA